MSIFYHPQIDNVIIKFLKIDDIAKLYQSNTYYRNILRQCISKYQNFFNKILPIKNGKNNRYILMLQAVMNKDIDICIYLFHRYTYTLKKLHSKNEFLFRTACEYGDLAIVQLLYEKMKQAVNFGAERCQAFVYSYGNGHQNIVDFLYLRVGISDEIMENAIMLASKNGNFDIINRLHDMNKILHKYKIKEQIFKNACMHGKLDFAKSLKIEGNKQVIKEAWCLAAKNLHTNVMEWLDSL